MSGYPALEKLVPNTLKIRLGPHLPLTDEHGDLAFDTPKMAPLPPASLLRSSPASLPPPRPPCQSALPSATAPRWRPDVRPARRLADLLKWRPQRRGPSARGTLGTSARAAGNGAERGRAGASSVRGSRCNGERARGEGRWAGARTRAGGGGGGRPRGVSGLCAHTSRLPLGRIPHDPAPQDHDLYGRQGIEHRVRAEAHRRGHPQAAA